MELVLILAIAFVLSCIPALLMYLHARRRFSASRVVKCPETKRPAVIRLNPGRAAATDLTGDPELEIEACSRWEGSVGHCHEGCMEKTERDRLVPG